MSADKKEFSNGQWFQRNGKVTRADVAKMIEQRDQIDTLNLQYLKIDSSADDLLKEFLHDNLNLRTLKISWTSLTEEQADILREELPTTLNLTTLRLSDDEVLEDLLKANNTSVERLILDPSIEKFWEGMEESLHGNLHVRHIDASELDSKTDYVAVFNRILDHNNAITEIVFNKYARPSPFQRELDEKLARNGKLLEILNVRLEQHFHKKDLESLFSNYNRQEFPPAM